MISLTLCPREILKAFIKSHSLPSPHGLRHHLRAIWVSTRGHPVPKHIQGTCGGLAEPHLLLVQGRRDGPGGTWGLGPSTWVLLLSLLHNPVVTSCIVKASPPGPHAILIKKKKKKHQKQQAPIQRPGVLQSPFRLPLGCPFIMGWKNVISGMKRRIKHTWVSDSRLPRGLSFQRLYNNQLHFPTMQTHWH